MHTGKIKKILKDRGFGFISDTDGREVFFHQSSLVDIKIADLTEEHKLTFDIELSSRGPSAVNIRVAP